MPLKLFNLWKLPVTSPASRNTWIFQHKWCLQKRVNHLTLRPTRRTGRNTLGRIILWTRGALTRKFRSVKINYNLRFNRLSYIASFQLVPFRNKLLTLVYFANGAITYYLAIENHKIFSYSHLMYAKKFKKFYLTSTHFMLYQIKKLSFVSVVELTPGRNAQYMRGTGAKGKILKFDKLHYSVLIQLPSGIKKVFSFFSFANLGRTALAENKKYFNAQAGYWRSFGVKSQVRGVAMNPVDHPHGGRTKSIRYPRTPWGKTTKFK